MRTQGLRNHRLFLTALLCLVAVGLWAQNDDLSYSERLELAERFDKEGAWLNAAEQYKAAYQQKPHKRDVAEKAAERFALIKDYAQAANLYAVVARNWRDYPLAGLKYARNLKQAGRFSEATAAYLDYLDYYRGKDKNLIRSIVESEVKGAQMAMQAEKEIPTMVVEQLGPSINSPFNELAPKPLAAGALYFLSDRKGKLMRMYRSFSDGKTWSAAEVAGQFPVVPGKHIGAGSLGPMGDRFYFTLCDQREFMPQPRAKCQIYVTLRKDTFWTVPQLLPEYINTKNNSTSHPFVYQEGDREVMIFASDRLDGYGGMDLYRADRYLNSEATDFNFPQNLGPIVNGPGDEVTPYYDPGSQTLYYSSNGFVGLGGYDVFKARGGATGYNPPENLKSPVNSAADDYYYHLISGTEMAFFSSNRVLDKGKSTSNNEDVYFARPGVPNVEVSVQIIDSTNGQPLTDVAVAAYLIEGSSKKLLGSTLSPDGYVLLLLPMGSTVELDLQRLDYHRMTRQFSTPKGKKEGFQLPRLAMSRIVLGLNDVKEIEANRSNPPVATLPTRPQTPPSKEPESTPAADRIPAAEASNQTQTTAVASAGSNASQVEVEPKTQSSVRKPIPEREYRIQIEARRDYDPLHSRYRGIERVGNLSSSYVDGKGLYRVMIGHYPTLREARGYLEEVKSLGYKDAFVVVLINGEYKGIARD